MLDNNSLLSELEQMLKWKKSKLFYAQKLNITITEVEELLKELQKPKEETYLYQVETVTNVTTPTYVSVHTNNVHITEEENNHITGNKKITLESSHPLSPKEIEELAGVDNITTFVDRSWLKSHKNGTWTYSILTVTKIKDFYTSEELSNKLKEIFSSTEQFNTIINEASEKALFVYIGDDHAGCIIKNSLFAKEYSGTTYANRLLQLSQEIKNLNTTFEHIYIIRMGDELDGFNGKTTRYDHDLGSASNKEQFDIYTIANKLFYDDVFSSEIALNYHLITLENSNHSGKSFSYFANRALEFWLEIKFPFVKISHQHKFIDVIIYGNHVIGLTHGKDEEHMKSPFPMNLDLKTDLWLMEYFRQYYLSNCFIHCIKADMHKFNMNSGKFGRYVSIPSISSGSNYIEHNYGDSDAGALLEIYSPNSKNIQTIPIWF